MPRLRKAEDGHWYIRGPAWGDAEHCTWQLLPEGLDFLQKRGLPVVGIRVPADRMAQLKTLGLIFTGGGGPGPSSGGTGPAIETPLPVLTDLIAWSERAPSYTALIAELHSLAKKHPGSLDPGACFSADFRHWLRKLDRDIALSSLETIAWGDFLSLADLVGDAGLTRLHADIFHSEEGGQRVLWCMARIVGTVGCYVERGEPCLTRAETAEAAQAELLRLDAARAFLWDGDLKQVQRAIGPLLGRSDLPEAGELEVACALRHALSDDVSLLRSKVESLDPPSPLLEVEYRYLVGRCQYGTSPNWGQCRERAARVLPSRMIDWIEAQLLDGLAALILLVDGPQGGESSKIGTVWLDTLGFCKRYLTTALNEWPLQPVELSEIPGPSIWAHDDRRLVRAAVLQALGRITDAGVLLATLVKPPLADWRGLQLLRARQAKFERRDQEAKDIYRDLGGTFDFLLGERFAGLPGWWRSGDGSVASPRKNADNRGLRGCHFAQRGMPGDLPRF